MLIWLVTTNTNTNTNTNIDYIKRSSSIDDGTFKLLVLGIGVYKEDVVAILYWYNWS